MSKDLWTFHLLQVLVSEKLKIMPTPLREEPSKPNLCLD